MTKWKGKEELTVGINRKQWRMGKEGEKKLHASSPPPPFIISFTFHQIVQICIRGFARVDLGAKGGTAFIIIVCKFHVALGKYDHQCRQIKTMTSIFLCIMKCYHYARHKIYILITWGPFVARLENSENVWVIFSSSSAKSAIWSNNPLTLTYLHQLTIKKCLYNVFYQKSKQSLAISFYNIGTLYKMNTISIMTC